MALVRRGVQMMMVRVLLVARMMMEPLVWIMKEDYFQGVFEF